MQSILTFQNPALMAVKTSILVFYLTLTRNKKVFRWANYITLAVVNVAGLVLTFVNVFQCDPVSAAYRVSDASSAKCIDIVTLYLSSAPVNIITDLAVLFLPMPILTQMRLPAKQKAILVVTFSFGFFVAVVDVVRIAFLQQAATSRRLVMKSIHLQDLHRADFSCMPQPRVLIGELANLLIQGMRHSRSCGRSSRSMSRSCVAASQV